MGPKRIKSLILLYCFVQLCLVVEASRKLPAPWDTPENGIESYRLLSEVNHIASKKLFILEESADRSSGAFRLDIANKSDGSKETYLNRLGTKELFHFKPYKCSLIDDINGSTGENFDKLLPTQDSWLVSGVGALWLYACGQKTTYVPASNAGNNKGNRILRTFNRYDIEESEEFPYKVKFFFRPNEQDNKLGFDDPRSLTTIFVAKDYNGTQTILLRVRILEFMSPLIMVKNEKANVFDVPLGYGCSRKISFNYSSPIDFDFRSSDRPYLIELSSISSVPTTESLHRHSWKSLTTTMRLQSGLIDAGNGDKQEYHIVETSSHELDKRSATNRQQLSKTNLKRTKKVWRIDKSSDKLDTNEGLFYEVDESKGKCLHSGKGLYETSASFLVPVMRADHFQGIDIVDSTENQVWHAGFPLNVENLKLLFSSTEGFHLIQESSPSWTSNIQKFEKRTTTFVLRNERGDIVWTAPASILREHRQFKVNSSDDFPFKPDNSSGQLNDDNWYAEIETTLILFTQSLDKVIATIKLSLIERVLANWPQFHRNLDVSSCLVPTLENHHLGPTKYHEDRVGFSINLINADESERVNALSFDKRVAIYREGLTAMLSASLTGHKLNLIQLVDLDVDSEGESLVVSGKLLKVPKLVNYGENDGVKFAHPQRSSSMLSEIKLNAEDCAESCSHYGCKSFSYCQGQSTCDMNLSDEPVALTLDSKCSVHELIASSATELSYVDPLNYLNDLKRKVFDSASSSEQSNNEGSFMIKYQLIGNKTLTLIADSVDINTADDIDAMNDFLSSQDLDSMGSRTSETDGTQKMKVEYEVLFHDRQYTDPDELNEEFPLHQATIKDYSQCETLCSSVDCRSFSYCKLDKTCVVSQLHSTDQIDKKTKSQSGSTMCIIMAREYLSKFSLPREMQSIGPYNKTGKLVEVAKDRRSCAASCMEESDFTCKSFQICKDKKSSAIVNCRIYEDTSFNDEKSKNDSETIEDLDCEFFKRSAMSNFNKYLKKSIPLLRQIENSNYQVPYYRDVTADDCASICADRGAECLGFDVCLDISDDGKMGKPECLVALNWTRLSPEMLETAPSCTAFLWDPKSNKDVRSKTIINNGGNSFNFTKSLLLLIFGAMLAYSICTLWKCRTRK